MDASFLKIIVAILGAYIAIFKLKENWLIYILGAIVYHIILNIK